MYNFNNIFSEYFQKFNNINPLASLNNLGFDQPGISNAFKQGVEFWNSVVQDFVSQAQQIINNNVEIVEKNSKEIVSALDDLANTNNVEQAFSRNQELVAKIVDNNLNFSKQAFQNASDIANENIQKYNKTAFNNNKQ